MLTLNAERRMLVESVGEIAESEFAERAGTWQGAKPWPNLELLADRGYLGVSLPEEYGGGGMSEFDAILLQETVGRVCPDTAYALPDMGAPRAVAMFGSEAVKERYLPPVCAGEDHVAIAISEPEAGSDVPSMRTRVEERDGELVLNGEKIWVSGVDEASAAVVWVKFPEGLGTLVLDLDAPGVEIGQHFTNMFGHTQTQFFMNDVVVPERNVLTRGSDAFKEQLKALNWERLGNAALSNGTAACVFDMALEYAGDREQFGQPIGEFQGIEWKLADMAKQVQTSRNQTLAAASAAERAGGVPDRLSTHIANLWSGEVLEEVASEALQIHGANGYQRGHPIEYFYRFARSRRIAAGTDEIQKNTIARVLKDGGLPSLV
ncbi:acyl-CoA dehydrogenase family protein [Salinirubellus sp. GCM10025818]|uniref:acyl-CoA dehydrogenase family protein n=1 Tax=Salinirubellus TaxID=2162630 RepID=UPI0030D274CC